MNRKLLLQIIFSLVCALVLSGCAATQPPTEMPAKAPTAPPAEAPAIPPTEPSTEPPTEPPPTSPLTGEVLESPLTDRLFAVSVNNIRAAMPQHGISQADIYCEMLAEGSITRCLGIFSDIGAVERLGSIRSARFYTLSLARMFNAILIRAGGSGEADQAISNLKWDELDGVKGNVGTAFYRDQQRRSSGYKLEHTLFTGGKAILEQCAAMEYPLTVEQPYDFGFRFATDAAPGGEPAGTITFAYGKGSNAKTTTMDYDSENGVYLASQFGESWIDGNTGQTLAFENVLVLEAVTYIQSDGVHRTIELVGSGKGYFACDGKIIPILWSREAESAPFVLTHEGGTPLTLGVGKTFMGIVPTNSDIFWE